MPQGKGSRYHNLRLYEEYEKEVPKNIDSSRTKENIVLIDKELTKAYDEIFGADIEQYNAKQTRSDRKIKSYIKKLENSKNGEQLFYEFVLQWGSKNDFIDNPTNRDIAKQCLIEYVEGFQKANPQLVIIGAYIHMDEASPHLHLDYVPVATGYKIGLSKRNSLDKAMKQMGYIPKGTEGKKNNATQVWKASERARFGEICKNHGLEVEPEEEYDREYLTPDEYKDIKDKVIEETKAEQEIKYAQEAQKRLSEIKTPEPEVKVHPLTKKRSVTLSEAEYKDLMMVHALETEKLTAENKALTIEKDNLNKKLHTMTSKSYVVENERLEAELTETKQELSALKVSHEELNQKYDEVSEKLESTKSLYQMSLQENRELEKDMKKAWIQVDELKEHVELLKNRLSAAAQTIKSLVQGYETVRLGENSVKLTDRQERLFTALSTIGKSVLQKIGFKNHSEELRREPYKINNEVKATIESLDQLEQKMKNKNLSHSRHRGMSR